MDIDDFKQYNDTWGHLAGDQALRTLANIIRSHLRTSDLVVRYGGEEFLILLPHTSSEQATIIAERLCQSIAETPCGVCNEKELPAITVSMGVSHFNRVDTCDSFLDHVDRSLYLAQEAGGNRVVNSNSQTGT